LHSMSGTAVTTSALVAQQQRLVCAATTDKGVQRAYNEDRFGAFPEIGLFVVADGMGGAAAGDVAAGMAIDLVCWAIVGAEGVRSRAMGSNGSRLALLLDAIRCANQGIHQAASRARACHGMGTTVAAVLFSGNRAVLAHVGDSRVYRLRGGRLALLTEDHSLFNDFVRAGKADPDKPEEFRHKHVITRAVGVDPTVEVDARLVDVAVGDTFLLCSDGLSGVVPHHELTSILTANADLDEAVEHLIARANELGGPDNVTAVLARWEPANSAVRACA
jgi:PPM family protein phosphatase